MRDLKTAIENLYETFSPYTTLGIQHCDCGCISEVDIKKLFSKPLKELTVDDLVFYQRKAMTTVEPGIYIEEEGMGIRIENNIWITENGNIDLFEGIPITVEEIEAVMKK